ncbi:unnamed protein product, partial [Ectocarpus fasciculatus]
LAFGTAPYLGRAVRLVVAYNREYRAKYARFVRKERMVGGWMALTVGLTIRAATFFGDKPADYSSNGRDCFFWGDTGLMT